MENLINRINEVKELSKIGLESFSLAGNHRMISFMEGELLGLTKAICIIESEIRNKEK